MRSEVLVAVYAKIVVFWDVNTVHPEAEGQIPAEHQYPSTELYISETEVVWFSDSTLRLVYGRCLVGISATTLVI
jgi:hypothetical protein